MPLQIVHSYESLVVERVIMAIYGGPGLGKSTLAFTADDPICFDFDGGAHRAKNRGDIVRVHEWADVATLQRSDVTGYKTAIIDTAGRALDVLSVKLIADDPKNARGSGALSLQGFGELKSAFTQWLNKLKSYGLEIVLVSHGSEERKGDDVIERLDIQGGSRGEVHKSADAMGRLYMQGPERILNFSPSEAAFGKNPGNLEPLVVPHYQTDPRFLGKVIAQIKATLNEQSEAGREIRERIEKAREVYKALATPEAFTEQAENLSRIGAETVIKALLLQEAGLKGYVFDREKKAFVAVPPPAAAPDAPATPAANGTGPATPPPAAPLKTATRGGRSANRRQG